MATVRAAILSRPALARILPFVRAGSKGKEPGQVDTANPRLYVAQGCFLARRKGLRRFSEGYEQTISCPRGWSRQGSPSTHWDSYTLTRGR